MDQLTDLADTFCSLVKSADDSYSPADKAQALIGNLKQVHHQIKNSGLEFDHTENYAYINDALHHIEAAMKEIAMCKDIVEDTGTENFSI